MNADIIMATLLLGGFIALMLFISYKGYKKSSAAKKATERTRERLGATMSATLKHTEGLPLAKGVFVQ